jgi:tetratricopeptide (TPR) repeat protein
VVDYCKLCSNEKLKDSALAFCNEVKYNFETEQRCNLAEGYLQKCEELRAPGDSASLDAAYAECKLASDSCPSLSKAYFIQSEIRFAQGRYKEALNRSKAYIDHARSSPDGYFLKGRSLFQLALDQEDSDRDSAQALAGMAREALRFALAYTTGANGQKRNMIMRAMKRLDDTFPEALIDLCSALGYRHLANGDYEQAAEAFTECICKEPRNAQAYNGRGLAYYYLENFEAALDDFTQAIRNKPHYCEAILNKGNTLIALDSLTEANEVLRQAIRCDSNLADPFFALGYVLIKTGNPQSAIDALREGLALAPHNCAALFDLGCAYLKANDVEATLRVFDECLEACPEDTGAYVNRGVALAMTEDFTGSFSSFLEALRLHPTDDTARYDYGLALAKSGDTANAGIQFDSAAHIGDIAKQGLAEAHFNRGVILHKDENIDGAVQAIRRAYQLATDSSEVLPFHDVFFPEKDGGKNTPKLEYPFNGQGRREEQ